MAEYQSAFTGAQIDNLLGRVDTVVAEAVTAGGNAGEEKAEEVINTYIPQLDAKVTEATNQANKATGKANEANQAVTDAQSAAAETQTAKETAVQAANAAANQAAIQLQALADTRYGNVLEVSGQGNSITLAGTVNRGPVEFDVLGESVQVQTPDSPSPAYPAAITDLEPYIHVRNQNLVNPADLISQGWVLQEDGSYYVASVSTVNTKIIYKNTSSYVGQYKIIISTKIIKNQDFAGVVLSVLYTDGTRDTVFNNRSASDFTEFIFITPANKKVDYFNWTYGSSLNPTWIKDFIITKDLSATSYIPPDSTDVYLGPDLAKKEINDPSYYISFTTGTKLSTSTGWLASDYIFINSNHRYVNYMMGLTSIVAGIAFYDELKNFISGTAGTNATQIIPIPVNAVFLRVSYRENSPVGYWLYFCDVYGSPVEGTLPGLKDSTGAQMIRNSVYRTNNLRLWMYKGITTKTFDGTNATWVAKGSVEGEDLRFNTALSDARLNNGYTDYLLNTHFLAATQSTVPKPENSFCYWSLVNSKRLFIRIGANLVGQGVTDVATWNAWLAAQAAGGTPMMVEYALRTPIVTEITDPVLLEKLNSIQMQTGETNIYLDGPDGEVSVTAVQDINYAVTEIKNAIAALGAV